MAAPQLPQPPVERTPLQQWDADAIRALTAIDMAGVLGSILSDMDNDQDIAECFIREDIDGETFLDAIKEPEVIEDVLADCTRPKLVFIKLKKQLRRWYPPT